MTEVRKTIWKNGNNLVTRSIVKTRRLTVSLSDIDLVEVRHPFLLPALGLSIAISLIVFRFIDVLLAVEISTLLGSVWIVFAIACCIGTLKLHSYSIDDLEITLPIWRARAMRNAIDMALSSQLKGKSANHIPAPQKRHCDV